MRNLRLALRLLGRAPSVTIIAVISLGLGIGATTAIFSLYNQMIRRPLPVHEPQRLVNLSAPGRKPGSTSCNDAGNCAAVFSYPMFRDLQKAQTVFTGIAAHRSFSVNLAYQGQTLNGDGILVSGSYFPVLGLEPALGRLLGPGDDTAIGQSPVVVLSHNYWRTRFDSSPAVVNQTLIVNGQALTIVGVAPAGFEGVTLGQRPQVFVPITLRELIQPGVEKSLERRRNYWAYLFARLKPDTSIEQAHIALNIPYHALLNDVEAPLQQGMTDQQLSEFRAKQVSLEPGSRGQSSIQKEAVAPFLILMIVTGLVLLIACANIANLMLARAAGRSGEMAIRRSIGATRFNLIAQLLTESLTLAVLGGIAGLAVARWTFALIVSLLPSDATLNLAFSLDPAVLLFAGTAALGAGVAFGLFPAIHSARTDGVTAPRGETGQPSGSRAAARFRWTLATLQIAMSTALLISAGLFTKSLFNISKVDLGLNVENMITFRLSPSLNGYKAVQSRALFEQFEAELAAQPGVTHVTASLVPLLTGTNWGNNVTVQGFESGPEVDSNSSYNVVDAGYFRTMSIPLISGREFTESDTAGTPGVAIVNEAFAKKFKLGRDAVGKWIKQGSGPGDRQLEIVGLVQNAKYSEVKQEIPPLFFLPYRQETGIGVLSFYVRGAVPKETLFSMIQPVVTKVIPSLPVEGLRTMEQTIQDNVSLDRILTVLCTAFATLATLLAAIGLYGVLSYTVAQRTREFGVRMALGAAPSNVRGMVLRQVGLMTLIGGGVGLAVAVGLGRLVESLLFQIKGYDPVIFFAASVLLAAVAMSAGFLPAHRASKIDPMRALRYE